MDVDLTNSVAQNEELRVFDLEELWDGRPVEELDLSEFLFKGMIVKEKHFREEVGEHDWSRYEDRHVAIVCSTDAIVPQWAWMLVASRLQPVAATVALGGRDELLREYYTRALEEVDWSEYEDRIVVVKGCGSDEVPECAYVTATLRLQERARKLMYGEACSSVPIWRTSKDETSSDARPAGVTKPDLPSPGS